MAEQEQKKGFAAQTIQGIKIAFATKKAAMAGAALLMGVSTATATYVATGPTAEELAQRQVMTETITAMEVQQEAMATQIIQLQEVHSDLHEHEWPEHEHESDTTVIPVILPGPRGPSGADGADGKDGIDGKDGKDGTNEHEHEQVPAHDHEALHDVPILHNELDPHKHGEESAEEVAPHDHGYWCDKGIASHNSHRHTWNPGSGCQNAK